MMKSNRYGLVATAMVAIVGGLLVLAPAPVRADGALAVGVPSDVAKDGFAYGRNVNSPTEAVARTRALELCQHAHDASDEARRVCTVVQGFHRQCVSVAMDPKAGTPGVGWAIAPTKQAAEKQALANCRATAGASRQQFCVMSDSACDTHQ